MNYKNLGEEPPDHAVGRSRGGLSTKIHQLCDGTAGRWWSCSDRGRAATRGCSRTCCTRCACTGTAPGVPAPPPTRSWATRPTPAADTARYCAAGASPPSSPNPTTRRPTANAAASRAAGHRRSTVSVQEPQRRRTRLQHLQAVAGPGHPLRQARPDLPSRSTPARRPHLASRVRRHALAATPPSIYGGSARPSALRAISRITHLPPTASRRMNPHLGT